MLEILGIIAVSRGLAAMAARKGRNAILFRILGVVAWLGGELLGGVVGSIVAMISNGTEQDPSMLIVYPFALAGAATCVGAMFLLVYLLPAVDAPGIGLSAASSMMPPPPPPGAGPLSPR
jgi:hypothetical protein